VQTLTVDLGSRSYPIYIGADLLSQTDLISQHISGNQVCVVTNETIAPLYLDKITSFLKNYAVTTVVLPDGESYKTLQTVNQIFDALLEDRHNRTTTLIALGGGVVGDMTGFAAASYQRGVNFIQVPTTLLSQVDSSVGGKTGVNHPLGKNMIGAFYQPKAVIADIRTFSTLPDREFAAGIAEVVKYGLICDAPFYEWLLNNIDSLLVRDENALAYAVQQSCSDKSKVVAEDEREGGIRAILNFGHTFGHAIETAQGYGKWLHGEAVAAGMVMAADLSWRLGNITQDDVQSLKTLLEKAKLPITPPADMDEDIFLQLMQVDKKVVDGSLRLVLLDKVGSAVVTSEFDRTKLQQVFAAEKLGQ